MCFPSFRPSIEKYKSYMFDMKLSSCQSDSYVMYLQRSALNLRLSPTVSSYISKRQPALPRTTKIAISVPDFTSCSAGEIGASHLLSVRLWLYASPQVVTLPLF
jgi:hypothetical protein